MQERAFPADLIERADAPEGFRSIMSISPFSYENGPIFEKDAPEGREIRGFRVEERHCNAAMIAHGGMIATFADVVAGKAAWDHGNKTPCLTIRLSVDYMGPSPLGAWVEAEVWVDADDGDCIFLRGTGTADGRPAFQIDAVFKRLAGRPKGVRDITRDETKYKG